MDDGFSSNAAPHVNVYDTLEQRRVNPFAPTSPPREERYRNIVQVMYGAFPILSKKLLFVSRLRTA